MQGEGHCLPGSYCCSLSPFSNCLAGFFPSIRLCVGSSARLWVFMSGRDFKCVVVSGKSCTHLDGKEGDCAYYSYDHAYEQEPCDGENPILEIAGYAATSGYSRRRLSARRSARCASRSATLSVACLVYVYRHSLGTCP